MGVCCSGEQRERVISIDLDEDDEMDLNRIVKRDRKFNIQKEAANIYDSEFGEQVYFQNKSKIQVGQDFDNQLFNFSKALIYEDTSTIRTSSKFDHTQRKGRGGDAVIQTRTEEINYGNPTQQDENDQDEPQIIKNLKHISGYFVSDYTLKQILKNHLLSPEEIKIISLGKFLGRGSYGSVTLNILDIQDLQQKHNLKLDLLPIATKFIEDEDQFQRECVVLRKLKGNVKPAVVQIDVENKKIHMEACVCSLMDIKSFIQLSVTDLDTFYSKLILELMQHTNVLLDQKIFHGDIKPANIAVTLQDQKFGLIFLDFGSASWDYQDYHNYFSKHFVNSMTYSKVCDNHILTPDEIRFSEYYSICRSIQCIIIPDLVLNLFKKKNTKEFIAQYSSQLPKCISILSPFLLSEISTFSLADYQRLKEKHQEIISKDYKIDIKDLYQKYSIFSK